MQNGIECTVIKTNHPGLGRVEITARIYNNPSGVVTVNKIVPCEIKGKGHQSTPVGYHPIKYRDAGEWSKYDGRLSVWVATSAQLARQLPDRNPAELNSRPTTTNLAALIEYAHQVLGEVTPKSVGIRL